MARVLKYFLIGYIALFAVVLPMPNINQVLAQTTNDADGDGVDDSVDDFIDVDGDGVPSFDSTGTYYGEPDVDDLDPCVPNQNNTACQDQQGVNPDGLTPLASTSIGQQQLPFECGVIYQGTLLGCVAVFLYYVVALPTAWIARGVAELFDYFVAFTINSGTYSNFQGFIYVGWQLLRDLCNIFFIFVLVYLGIRQIFGKGGDTRQIFKIIVAALLINFSLFFGKVIVDAGNILGRAFYSSIQTSSDGNQATKSATGNTSISALLMSSANPQELLLSTKFESDLQNTANQDLGELSSGDDTIKDGQYIVILLMLAFFNIAIIKVFISLCLLMVARTVGIWFLLILSPFAFLTMILPVAPKGLSEYSFGNWVKKLANLSLMVAVFMFFIYLAALFFSASSGSILFLIPNESFLASFLRIMIPFALIIFILNMAKKRAGEMTGEYGGFVMERFGQLAGFAMGAAGLAFGGAASLTRIGTGAASRGLARRAASLEARGKTARAARVRRLSKYAGRATGDLRNVKIGGQSIIGKASQYANQYVLKEATGVNLDLGKGGTKTYESAVKARQEKLKKRAEDEKAGDDDKIVPYGYAPKRDENGNIIYNKKTGEPELEYRKLKPEEIKKNKHKFSKEEEFNLSQRAKAKDEEAKSAKEKASRIEEDYRDDFDQEEELKREYEKADNDVELASLRTNLKTAESFVQDYQKRKADLVAQLDEAVREGRAYEEGDLRNRLRQVDDDLTAYRNGKDVAEEAVRQKETDLGLRIKKTDYESKKTVNLDARKEVDYHKKLADEAEKSRDSLNRAVNTAGKVQLKSKKEVENELLKAKDSAETKIRVVEGIELEEVPGTDGKEFRIKSGTQEKDFEGLEKAKKANEEKMDKWRKEISDIKAKPKSMWESLGSPLYEDWKKLVDNIDQAKKVEKNIGRYLKSINDEYKPQKDMKAQADLHIKATNKKRLMEYAQNGLWDVHSSLGDLRRGNVDLFANAEGKERARLDVENQALKIDDKEK